MFSLCSAWDWKKKHAGFHFPTFYNFIVDTFEDPEDDLAKTCADKLLQWWNRYVYVQYPASGVLIPSPLFSNVFLATDSAAGDENSHRAMLNCRKRLREGHSRHAQAGRTSACDNAGRTSDRDNTGCASAREDVGRANARDDAQ